MVSLITLIGAVLCVAVIGVGAVAGVVVLLVKLGVIAKKAAEPPHIDSGSYTLDMGREVRAEEGSREPKQ